MRERDTFKNTKEMWEQLRSCNGSDYCLHEDIWEDLTLVGKWTIGIPLIVLTYILAAILFVVFIVVMPFIDLWEKYLPSLPKIGRIFFK